MRLNSFDLSLQKLGYSEPILHPRTAQSDRDDVIGLTHLPTLLDLNQSPDIVRGGIS